MVGDIIRRAINPWKASIRTAGTTYDSFQQVDHEEYHDFRNGIGLESALPAESARLWWSEGIDFSTARSAVLGPLVNIAGAFGVAPVKIIDFQGSTYAIGHNKIAKWVTSPSAQTITLRPNAAGGNTGLTPSAGANWECVDEETPDEDTTYVYITDADGYDTYTTDLVAGSGTINEVRVYVRGRYSQGSAYI